jgi:hypothetical protein
VSPYQRILAERYGFRLAPGFTFVKPHQRGGFWAIQCKCYAPKRKVGPSVVRELIGALAAYPPGTLGMVVTTSGYSSCAVDLARQSGVTLRLLIADADGRMSKFSEI